MLKKILRQIAIYIIFTLVLYVASIIIKNEHEVVSLKELFSFYLILVVMIAPSWFGILFGVQRLNRIGFMLQPFYNRVMRNLVIALVLSLVSLCIMYYVRSAIFNDPGYEKLLSRYFVFIFVNAIIILFVEYYSFYFQSKEEEIRIEKEKNEVLNLRYKVLKEQINPHFLFNSLNVLSSLIYENQQKANKYTKQLSKLYRYILNNSEKDKILLEQELKFVESYFYILKLRFNSSIQLSVDVGDEHLENYVIPLSLQVLIENAIKHNVFSNELPLDIAIEVKEGFVHVTNDKRQTKIKEESSGRGLLYLEVLYNRFDKKIEVISDEKQFIVKLPLL